MEIGFVTGNSNKHTEVSVALGKNYTVHMLQADLPEVQSMDPIEIIKPKLEAARKLYPNVNILIVEDTSFCINALYELPGTMIKHFLEAPARAGNSDPMAGPDMVYKMARGVQGTGEIAARAIVHIGYIDQHMQREYFAGEVKGYLLPAGNNGWGFDRILVPHGHGMRLGDLGPEIKSKISHRAAAARKLKWYLGQQYSKN